MKDRVHIVSTFALVILLTLAMSTVIFAQDYVPEAVQSLQNSPVYIAPGTEKTNRDTASQLQRQLTSNDTIVLVMFPASAGSGEDIYAIVTRLSEGLGNQRIIGLAVGNEVIGYAPMLSSDVAPDQMRRAKSVSNDPVTALGTFAQNMHLWQRANPQPTPIVILPSKENGGGWLIWLVVFIVIFTVFSGLVSVVRGTNETIESGERTSFRAPNPVKDLLAEIAREREKINDRALRDALYQMCIDIEKYFQSGTNDKKKDAVFFQQRLIEVVAVLKKYVDVQNNPRYYYHPLEELSKGKESMIDFSQYVLDSIRRGNAVDLLDYAVNTKILQAQRYR